MNISLLIHCDLEPVPMKQMPNGWSEPAIDAAVAVAAGLSVEILHESPPCISYSRPARRPTALEVAK